MKHFLILCILAIFLTTSCAETKLGSAKRIDTATEDGELNPFSQPELTEEQILEGYTIKDGKIIDPNGDLVEAKPIEEEEEEEEESLLHDNGLNKIQYPNLADLNTGLIPNSHKITPEGMVVDPNNTTLTEEEVLDLLQLKININNGELVQLTTCALDSWGDTHTFGPYSTDIQNYVQQVSNRPNCSREVPPMRIIRTTNGSGSTSRPWVWNDGTLHQTNLNKVCNLLGYSTYKSSTCKDNDDHSRYGGGKCHYHVPDQKNDMLQWNGSSWQQRTVYPIDRFKITWLMGITCSDKIYK